MKEKVKKAIRGGFSKARPTSDQASLKCPLSCWDVVAMMQNFHYGNKKEKAD